MPAIVVKPAKGLEIKLCRMLLGNEGSMHPHYHLFVAVDETGRPLGAGSVRSGAEAVEEYWGVHVTEIPGAPAEKVKSSLLTHAKRHASAHGATILQTLRWLEQDSAEESSWRSLGFERHQLRYAHEIGVERCGWRLQPLLEQVRDHGWIPEDARIIPLDEADIEGVFELHLKYLGGQRRTLMPLLDGTAPHPYDRQASVVLVRGDRTLGFTLGWFPDSKTCEIAADVLDPSVRLGWADLVLKCAACERVKERGAEQFRFCTAEHHSDSRRTMGWIGEGTTRVEVRMQTSCAGG